MAQQGTGPLFYRTANQQDDTDPLKAKKPRYVQARQRLASWVRGLGVSDKELSPNHAWRHSFKQIADRAGISERMSDYITGHAHKSVGAAYGAPMLNDMAEALKRFQRYESEGQTARSESAPVESGESLRASALCGALPASLLACPACRTVLF